MTSHLQANPNQMAIGADYQYVRLWDRRMLSAGGHLVPPAPPHCADEGGEGPNCFEAINWPVTQYRLPAGPRVTDGSQVKPMLEVAPAHLCLGESPIVAAHQPGRFRTSPHEVCILCYVSTARTHKPQAPLQRLALHSQCSCLMCASVCRNDSRQRHTAAYDRGRVWCAWRQAVCHLSC